MTRVEASAAALKRIEITENERKLELLAIDESAYSLLPMKSSLNRRGRRVVVPGRAGYQGIGGDPNANNTGNPAPVSGYEDRK